MILAVDTTGPDCSAAFHNGERELGKLSERIGRGHAERLAPVVEAVLQSAGVAPAAVTRLAVCTGPGSFTGLRVGLAFVKGFALPRGLPIIGVNALTVAAVAEQGAKAGNVAVFRDIRRGEVMYARFAGGRPVHAPEAVALEFAQADARAHAISLIEAETIDVGVLARLAHALDPADHPPVAFYSRCPDAKLPGGLDPQLGTAGR